MSPFDQISTTLLALTSIKTPQISFFTIQSTIINYSIGPPISITHPRTPTRQLHPLGSSLHSSGPYPQISLRPNKPPCERVNARKSHKYRFCKLPFSFYLGVCRHSRRVGEMDICMPYHRPKMLTPCHYPHILTTPSFSFF